MVKHFTLNNNSREKIETVRHSTEKDGAEKRRPGNERTGPSTKYAIYSKINESNVKRKDSSINREAAIDRQPIPEENTQGKRKNITITVVTS